MAISCSIFTNLWNPIGFPFLAYDEGTYIGRAMNLLVGQGFEDYSILYDHPYFGQIFLAGIFWITGYPESMHPSSYGNVVHSVEMLWLEPRVLMGFMAIIDTILVYKISEHLYKKKAVAFTASILYAIMSPNWFLRQAYLDTILLPFVLFSIYFAISYNVPFSSLENQNNKSVKKNRKKNIISILLSGLLLGLAIFTKIPSFTMIPLVGFLIYRHNKSIKILGIWFIPVILIPLLWPAYAVSIGQFDLWLDGIYYQTHRENRPLMDSLSKFFNLSPFLVGLGIIGLFFAGFKRDLPLLLWVGPYFVFLFFIGLVREFHLVLIFPVFCIAAARLVVELYYRVSNKNFQRVLLIAIVSCVGFFGLANTITLTTTNVTSHYLEAVAFVVHYLQLHADINNKNSMDNNYINSNDEGTFIRIENGNKPSNVTVISNHVYSWIPRYVFQIPADYKEPYDDISPKGSFLLVVDKSFQDAMIENDTTGMQLKKIYEISKTNISSYIINGGPYENSLELIITDPLPNDGTKNQPINLIDEDHVWKTVNDAKASQNDSELIIKVKTNSSDKLYNRAVLQTQLGLVDRPLILNVEYFSKTHEGNATFAAEIKDKIDGYKSLWLRPLNKGQGGWVKESFILHEDAIGRPIEFSLYVITNGPGEHSLIMKNINITSN